MEELRVAAEEQKGAAFNRFLQERIVGQEALTAVLDAVEEPAREESCPEDPTKLGVQELCAWAGRSTACLIQVAEDVSAGLRGDEDRDGQRGGKASQIGSGERGRSVRVTYSGPGCRRLGEAESRHSGRSRDDALRESRSAFTQKR
ncbi:jg3731 [Pararge aegeria aegeria]|uniref:Jg3731 protein n=1 Tax=Pararge aegeria aegeria TaxID=348720 RepID=A0A8S4QZZ6_9NEOP|nr:jg3731 [Pararge aegeria aegeria]